MAGLGLASHVRVLQLHHYHQLVYRSLTKQHIGHIDCVSCMLSCIFLLSFVAFPIATFRQGAYSPYLSLEPVGFWPVRRQTYCYLQLHGASLACHWYHITLLGERGTCV